MISFHDSSYFPSTPNVSGCFWWHQKNTIPNFNEFSSGEKVTTEKSTAFHRQKFTGLDPQIEAVDEGAFDKVWWGWWMFFGSSPCVVLCFVYKEIHVFIATPQQKWQNSCPTCQNMYLINPETHLEPVLSCSGQNTLMSPDIWECGRSNLALTLHSMFGKQCCIIYIFLAPTKKGDLWKTSWQVWLPNFWWSNTSTQGAWSGNHLNCFVQRLPGWWFQIGFIFAPIKGRWASLTDIFQMAWNHQLASSFKPLRDPSSVRSLKFYLFFASEPMLRFFCSRHIFLG